MSVLLFPPTPPELVLHLTFLNTRKVRNKETLLSIQTRNPFQAEKEVQEKIPSSRTPLLLRDGAVLIREMREIFLRLLRPLTTFFLSCSGNLGPFLLIFLGLKSLHCPFWSFFSTRKNPLSSHPPPNSARGPPLLDRCCSGGISPFIPLTPLPTRRTWKSRPVQLPASLLIRYLPVVRSIPVMRMGPSST